MNENTRGSLIMICAMVGFTTNDAIIKLLGAEMSLFQMVFLRGLPCIVFLFLLAWSFGHLRPNAPAKDWYLVALRSLMEVGSSYFFIAALLRMELANVNAVLQVLPLSVALTAALVFREPLGWRRLLAIGIGFVGVMLIIRPGPDGFTQESIYALIAVAMVTVRDLAARRMSQAMPSLLGALFAAIALTIFAGIGVLFVPWVPVSGGDFGLLLLAALLVGGGYLASVMAMRVGEISFVTPFRYTGLLVSLLLGFLLFGDWPDFITLLGALIVVVTGLFTLYRESLGARGGQPS